MAADPIATSLPTWSVLPFAGLLGAIAVLPLIHRTAHWWEENRNKFMVSAACGLLALGIITMFGGGSAAAGAAKHAAMEFVPFMVLLFSLYAISGGILISGDIPATPRSNTLILAIGAVLANLLGTTGASMLLIRPLLRANRRRARRAHVVVFFIFTVSNCGGLLLPIGDPPLFLGYLRGIPFTWTLGLLPEWLIVNVSLLALFLAIDTRLSRRPGAMDAPEGSPLAEPPIAEPAGAPIRVRGMLNVIWLAGVVLSAALLVPGARIDALGFTVPEFMREGVMLACAGLSLWLTPWSLRRENRFAFTPIIEVAALFSGLFVAMQPALEILAVRGADLGVQTPAQFFWATGLLSSVLDNAPTYLVFADVAATITPEGTEGAIRYGTQAIDAALLTAVSCGAVFMGAVTYIGNGPNLMVAAIAREDGVPMPSFFGYMLWSGALLLPLFAVVTWVIF
jgi:Na+/H+ antiporter NhaD/arsenite permease-like protein